MKQQQQQQQQQRADLVYLYPREAGLTHEQVGVSCHGRNVVLLLDVMGSLEAGGKTRGGGERLVGQPMYDEYVRRFSRARPQLRRRYLRYVHRWF